MYHDADTVPATITQLDLNYLLQALKVYMYKLFNLFKDALVGTGVLVERIFFDKYIE